MVLNGLKRGLKQFSKVFKTNIKIGLKQFSLKKDFCLKKFCFKPIFNLKKILLQAFLDAYASLGSTLSLSQ